jgi:beta-glucosidase
MLALLALPPLFAVGSALSTEDVVADLVANLTTEEKYGFVNGIGWDDNAYDNSEGYYIGNIPGVDRLGIPSLNMQDAGQGFRTTDARMVGQVTSWSCSLGLGSTWDSDLVYEWASAVADEYRTKVLIVQ